MTKINLVTFLGVKWDNHTMGAALLSLVRGKILKILATNSSYTKKIALDNQCIFATVRLI